MEVKKLVPQFKRGVVGQEALFDIPTGKFVVPEGFTESGMLNGTGKTIGTMMSHQMSYPRSTGRSMLMHNLLEQGIRETKGGTVERFNYAVGLFKYMGFTVEWDGTLSHPKVGWIDTEGWSADWDVSAFITSKLMDDVEVKPDHELLGEHFHAQLKNLKDESKHRVDLTIDSFSTLD